MAVLYAVRRKNAYHPWMTGKTPDIYSHERGLVPVWGRQPKMWNALKYLRKYLKDCNPSYLDGAAIVTMEHSETCLLDAWLTEWQLDESVSETAELSSWLSKQQP